MRTAFPPLRRPGGQRPSTVPILAAEAPRPIPAWDMKLGFFRLATSGNTETSSSGFDASSHH